MGSKLFRNPQALSSALAALGTLQPRAFVFLNNLDPLDSASNYYLDSDCHKLNIGGNKFLSQTSVHGFPQKFRVEWYFCPFSKGSNILCAFH